MDRVGWINATTGKRRFFLIDIDGVNGEAGHTMAAAKNRKGRLRFYDPNGGVVSTWFSSRMHQFLRHYLSSKKVFDNYPHNDGTMKLIMRKYRPDAW